MVVYQGRRAVWHLWPQHWSSLARPPRPDTGASWAGRATGGAPWAEGNRRLGTASLLRCVALFLLPPWVSVCLVLFSGSAFSFISFPRFSLLSSFLFVPFIFSFSLSLSLSLSLSFTLHSSKQSHTPLTLSTHLNSTYLNNAVNKSYQVIEPLRS